MKQSLWGAVGALVLGSMLVSGVASAWDTLWEYSKAFAQLETMISLDRATISVPLPYDAIYEFLENYCTAQDLEYAQIKREEFLNLRTTKALFAYNNSIRKQIRFDETKQQLLALSKNQDNHHCAKTYFLYEVLELIQDPVASDPIVVLQHNTMTWDKQLFSSLTEQYIQERFKTLVEEGILDQQDIARLYDKIHVNYIQSCGSVHGAFHMLVWPDRREVSKIVLNINTCTADPYLNNFSSYVNQILVHELWHYIYYFKDFDHDDFDKICRANNSSRCLASDFVSSYAQRSKEEDYAESFAYWYLVEYPNSPSDKAHTLDPANRVARSRRTKKLDYFNKLV